MDVCLTLRGSFSQRTQGNKKTCHQAVIIAQCVEEGRHVYMVVKVCVGGFQLLSYTHMDMGVAARGVERLS